jgi:anthranilate 1,2-dioxygenase large subunit
VTESSPIRWPQTEGVRRVPYRVFTDPAVYEREQERLFGGRSWNYVALDAELPNPGDFKATFIADTPVIVCRNRDGEPNAMVKPVCASRGPGLPRAPGQSDGASVRLSSVDLRS